MSERGFWLDMVTQNVESKVTNKIPNQPALVCDNLYVSGVDVLNNHDFLRRILPGLLQPRDNDHSSPTNVFHRDGQSVREVVASKRSVISSLATSRSRARLKEHAFSVKHVWSTLPSVSFSALNNAFSFDLGPLSQ